MSKIAEAKQALRKETKEKISNLAATDAGKKYMGQASLDIETNVTALKEYRNAQTVFVYVHMAKEVATEAILINALAKCKKVCVPRCLEDGIMEAVVITSRRDLTEAGPFGIMEPKPGLPTVKPEEIDFCIVPCVTCNHKGERLGHGGGYYDRFLAQNENMTTCLINFEEIVVDEIPREEHDKIADIVVTEKGIFR